jgi:pentatricopeptide repeat protein
VVTYNTLIDVHGKTGQWAEALKVRRGCVWEVQLHAAWRALSLPPHPVCCHCCCLLFLQVIDHMNSNNAKPVTHTYNTWYPQPSASPLSLHCLLLLLITGD